jgi:hypothetical protein
MIQDMASPVVSEENAPLSKLGSATRKRDEKYARSSAVCGLQDDMVIVRVRVKRFGATDVRKKEAATGTGLGQRTSEIGPNRDEFQATTVGT